MTTSKNKKAISVIEAAIMLSTSLLEVRDMILEKRITIVSREPLLVSLESVENIKKEVTNA